MQIVSCQYFSRGGRIREGLPKKPVQTQVLLLVTSNMLTLLKSKTTAKVKSLRSFKKRCQTASKFENDLLKWSL